MARADQHSLVQEACSMGFDRDLTVAGLLSFAQSKTGGNLKKLTVQQHGDAFIDYLFSCPQPPQQQQLQQHCQQLEQQHLAGASASQQQRQQPRRGCKRSSPDTDSIEASDDASMDGDSDFLIDDEGFEQPQAKALSGIKQQAAGTRVQPQQQRKRLRKSCEAAAPPTSAYAADATAAAADSDCDPAAQIARHRHRVLQDSSSDEELADAGGVYAAAVTAAAAAGGDVDGLVSRTRQPAAVRIRYQQAAAGGAHKLQLTAAVDLDCIITQSTPGHNRAPRGKNAGANTQQTQQQPRAQQGKPTQQKQRKLSTGPGGLDAGQSKLDKFFSSSAFCPASTPAHQQAPAAAAAAAAGAGMAPGPASVSRTGPSPLNLSRVTSSSQRKSNSFASRMQAEGLQAGFKTPAAANKGPSSLAGMPAGGGGVLGGGWQGQGGAGPTAAAAGVPAAPWWRPLTAAEGNMSPFDLVNLKVFGHSSFRPAQRDIVVQAAQHKDLFVLMPTGGGKSLCYQLPAVMARGVTVVVCPLLSLMQDQVRALCQNPNGGIPATFLSSQQSEAEAVAVKKELSKTLPTVKLLYVTPEQLVKSEALRRILHRLDERGLLARFVIDEAHCVSTWGHDFRQDYQKLSILRREFKKSPITAVTATATADVQADIIKTLGITRSAVVHKTSFLRPNLLLTVVPKIRERDEEAEMPICMVKLIEYIKRQQARAEATAAGEGGGPAVKQEQQGRQQRPAAAGSSKGVTCSGIVYCLSRKEAEQVAGMLKEVGGIRAKHYHAGMTPKQRTEVQNEFFSGAVQVIVATIAFGMGIDKPDVRFVVHFCMSKSLEGYYQEAGRAGRDGRPAECVMMFSPADVNRHTFLMRKSLGGNKSTKRFTNAVNQLEQMRQYALNPDKLCRHAQLLDYFGVLKDDLPDRHCRTANGASCDVCRGTVIPLNPEEWTVQNEDAEGLADEPIDLLSEEEDDHDDADNDEDGCGHQQQQRQQQQRSGGQRRGPLYRAGEAAAGGEGDVGVPGGGGIQGGDGEQVEILDSESEEEGSGTGSGSGSDEGGSESGSEGWSDGDSDDGPEPGGRRHAQREQQQQRQPRLKQQQQPQQQQQQTQQQQQQRQQQQRQQGRPVFQGFQRASQLLHDDIEEQQQQQQKQQPRQQRRKQEPPPPQQQQQQQRQQPGLPGYQKASLLPEDDDDDCWGQPPQHQQQQQPKGQAFQSFQMASRLVQDDETRQHQQQQQQAASVTVGLQHQQQQQIPSTNGFQRASDLRRQQLPVDPLGQQQQQQGVGGNGLGLGSSRFNASLLNLSWVKPVLQKLHRQQPAVKSSMPAAGHLPDVTGGGSGSDIPADDNLAGSSAPAARSSILSTAAAAAVSAKQPGAAAGAAAAAAGPAAAAGVRVGPWVTKKRLGMTGPLSGGGGSGRQVGGGMTGQLSGGGGSGSGRQVGGSMGPSSGGASIKLSPASALAKDLQEADDMF